MSVPVQKARACLANNSLVCGATKVTKFFTASSLFLALNSVFVAYFSFILYNITPSLLVMLAVFLSTFGVYGLNKATDSIEDSINKPESAKKGSHYIIPSIICYLSSLGIGLYEGPIAFAILLTPLIIGFIYSVKVCSKVPRLKEVLGVKSILVAFSWAFTGALLPALMGTVSLQKVIIVFCFIFIQLFVNTVLFDVLDIKGDKVSGIRTIPVHLGYNKTRWFLSITNSVLLILVGYCWLSELFIPQLTTLIFGISYGYAIVWYYTSQRGKRFSAELFVDGEWLPLVMALKLI